MKASDMTPRDRVLAKLQRVSDGETVQFEPLEAKIAGVFTEDALSPQEAEESNGYDEENN